MAPSGMAIVGFVIVHLVGTLKILLGPDKQTPTVTLAISSPWLPNRTRRRIAATVALVTGVGYANIPIAVLTGVLGPCLTQHVGRGRQRRKGPEFECHDPQPH